MFKIKNLILKNPYILAPMSGWTNLAYRLLARKYGCSLAFAEMIKARAFMEGSEKTKERLMSHINDRPLGVQLLGQDDPCMEESAQKLEELGIDLIDINMGCPVPKVVSKGEGAALLKQPDKVMRLIRRVRRATNLPLTIKIRSGWCHDQVNAIEIAKIAQDEGIDALTIHGRTREQGYRGSANWEIIAQIKQILKIPVIGSGDIFLAEDAQNMIQKTGCDGVMIARGSMGSPWIFYQLDHLNQDHFTIDEVFILDHLRKHFELMVQYMGLSKSIFEIRKVACKYFKGLHKASVLRNQLSQIDSYESFHRIIDHYQKHYL